MAPWSLTRRREPGMTRCLTRAFKSLCCSISCSQNSEMLSTFLSWPQTPSDASVHPLSRLTDPKDGKPVGNIASKFQLGMIETHALLPGTSPSLQKKTMFKLLRLPPDPSVDSTRCCPITHKASLDLSPCQSTRKTLPNCSAVPSSEIDPFSQSFSLSLGTSTLPTMLYIFSLRLLFPSHINPLPHLLVFRVPPRPALLLI